MVTTALTGNCGSCKRSIRPLDSPHSNVAIFNGCKHQFHLECLDRDVLNIHRKSVGELLEFTCMGRATALATHHNGPCTSVVHIKVVEEDVEGTLKVSYNQSNEEKEHKKVEIYEVGVSGSLTQVRHIPLELNPQAAHHRVVRELNRRFGAQTPRVIVREVVRSAVRGAGMLLNLAMVSVVAFAFSYFATLPALCVTATMLALSFTLQARLSSRYSRQQIPINQPQET